MAVDNKVPKQLKKIAKEENISLGYLRKLISPLEKAGIIKSLRGPGGGFILARKPSEIDLYEVVNVLNKRKVIDCAKGLSSCKRYGDCVAKDLLEEVYNKVELVFKRKTLDKIIKKRGSRR